MTDEPQLPEQVLRWMANNDADKERCDRASSVAAIAEMAGLPQWKVFKVVAAELEQRVIDKLGKRPSDEVLMNIITESILYSCELTREDGWDTVWPKRRMQDLKYHLSEYKR